MPIIKQLTFSVSDMKEYAMKALLSCKESLEDYRESACQSDLLNAACSFGKACEWLNWLSDIGVEYSAQDQDVCDLLDLAERFGLEW